MKTGVPKKSTGGRIVKPKTVKTITAKVPKAKKAPAQNIKKQKTRFYTGKVI
ncbi:hypothetical protein M0R19_04735 [Candidatus Pacearchaeota archaeon]|jgi:hypothetical protein|nr:hypothetical protein [Candidatus Pacearchaeota archaeon]